MIIQISMLNGPAINRITRLYETEGMAGLKHGKHSRREGKNRIQSENKSACCNSLFARGTINDGGPRF